ncbi:MAG: ATP-binding cassette domain-containing protein [Chitinophagaceae bacterium]
MSIEVKNLLKEFGEQKAVNNISFKVNMGEVVGFLGPNGAGKSTTMKIITGYLKQTDGEALVTGINVAENPLEIKKKIGYLPELNALYQDMYVKEYLEFITEVHGIDRKKQAITKALETVGLMSESKKKIGQLSKGYKQRTGLAAALIHDPEVLILDEPTSGLDPNQIIEIREVIKQQGLKKTVLFSSHILQEVEAICDRVIIINKGTLVADDKLSNLSMNSNASTIVILEIKETIDEEMVSGSFGPGVIRANATTWKFNTADPEKLKKQLVEFTLRNNLNIISLQSETRNLEDVFRNLTAKSKD